MRFDVVLCAGSFFRVMKKLTKAFNEFFENEKSAGLMLMAASVISLFVANTALSTDYIGFWKMYVGGLTISYWINDGLMAIFFLLIGLELKRELYNGELSNFKEALLPIFGAIGGVTLPALIHYSFNAGLPTQGGIGIPMATDIAFALSILALLGSRVPFSLKVLLTAIAVLDDLVAIIVIAVFYTAKISTGYLFGALIILAVLALLNRGGVKSLIPYLLGGAVLWFFMLQSGVHATIAGVLLAFTIPFNAKSDDEKSPSYILEHNLHKPVAFFILPVFALANTALAIAPNWAEELMSPNSTGIILGLLIGKVFGVSLFSFIAVRTGICSLPRELRWSHIIGLGFLAGIGFTMSIFITNLAFKGQLEMINSSIIAVLFASVVSGIIGYLWLFILGGKNREKVS